MPLSIPKLKFLVDENVRVELSEFFKTSGVDFELVSKGATDKEIASLSKSKRLILVTNDNDFFYYKKTKIFAVVLLKLPQNNAELLISSFSKLFLKEKFAGKLIVLTVSRIEEYSLEENKEAVF